MTPIFVVFMVVCAKAWVDGVLGRPYTWVKTSRSDWSALRPLPRPRTSDEQKVPA
jgi:hypothetical protein